MIHDHVITFHIIFINGGCDQLVSFVVDSRYIYGCCKRYFNCISRSNQGGGPWLFFLGPKLLLHGDPPRLICLNKKKKKKKRGRAPKTQWKNFYLRRTFEKSNPLYARSQIYAVEARLYTGQINEKKRKKVAAKTTPEVREDINGKKTFSFGHCPNHLNPPPPDPNSGNLVLFFYVKNDVLRVWPNFFWW